jgi:hypothetical protein
MDWRHGSGPTLTSTETAISYKTTTTDAILNAFSVNSATNYILILHASLNRMASPALCGLKLQDENQEAIHIDLII